MIIALDSLEAGPVNFDLKTEGDPRFLEGENVVLARPARFSGKVFRGEGCIEVEGEIDALFEVACSRCLEPVEFPFASQIRTRFEGIGEPVAEVDSEIDISELDVGFIENDNIDLNELFSEQLHLGLPVKLHCRPDCKGLCEKCGANRNLIDCNCTDNEIDPRWSALKELS